MENATKGASFEINYVNNDYAASADSKSIVCSSLNNYDYDLISSRCILYFINY